MCLATLLLKLSANNVPLRQKLKVNLKSHPKCIGIVLEKFLIWMFQHDATIRYLFDK